MKLYLEPPLTFWWFWRKGGVLDNDIRWYTPPLNQIFENFRGGYIETFETFICIFFREYHTKMLYCWFVFSKIIGGIIWFFQYFSNSKKIIGGTIWISWDFYLFESILENFLNFENSLTNYMIQILGSPELLLPLD